jgi:hypothetical protein
MVYVEKSADLAIVKGGETQVRITCYAALCPLPSALCTTSPPTPKQRLLAGVTIHGVSAPSPVLLLTGDSDQRSRTQRRTVSVGWSHRRRCSLWKVDPK